MKILISAEKITSVKRKKWRKKGHGYKQFVIVDIGYQEPKSTKKKETETKGPDKLHKPLWIELNKNDFDALIRDVYDNLDKNEFKNTIDGKTYDLKNKTNYPKNLWKWGT